MSFFNPQAIPEFALRIYDRGTDRAAHRARDVFPTPPLWKAPHNSDGEDDFRNDVAVLRAYSLISVMAEKGVLKMHPLVQHCALAWLSSAMKAERWRLAFIKLMERELLSKKLANWEECKQLVAHIDTFHPGEPGDKSFIAWISLTKGAGELLQEKFKYNEAAILVRRALEGVEKLLGKQHPNTLRTIYNLANVLHNQGDYGEAERLHRRVLEAREKELGTQHPDTLTSVHGLAELLVDKKMFVAAESLYRRALEGREKSLSPQHSHTLVSMSGLAHALHQQKRYEEASSLYQQACDGLTQRFGSQHLKTVVCLNRFATMQQESDTTKLQA